VIFSSGGSNPPAGGHGPAGLVGGDQATAEDPNAITALWRASAQTNLPAPRTNLAAFTVNGGIYVQGGNDGSGPRPETWWATPDAEGVIPQWNHLPQTDLGAGIEGASSFTSGSYAFLVGGRGPSELTGGAARANLAPQEPFFQAACSGGRAGPQAGRRDRQQIGYLKRRRRRTVNFVLLLLVGCGLRAQGAGPIDGCEGSPPAAEPGVTPTAQPPGQRG